MSESKNIRVGILVDGEVVQGWIHEIIMSIQEIKGIEICCVVINTAGPRAVGFSKHLYRLLRKTDRWLFSRGEQMFRKIPLQLEDSVERISVLPLQKKFTDQISATDCEIIKATKPDLLLRFGFRILKGEILSLAPFGVLSLHHGDSTVNRGGPPAFWEVVNRERVTGVTLQRLTDQLDGGLLLNKAFVTTDSLSFHRNQCAVYAAGIFLFVHELRKICETGINTYFNAKLQRQSITEVYSRLLFKDPGTKQTFLIFCKYLYRLFSHFIKKQLYHKKWVMLLGKKKDSSIKFAAFQLKKFIPPSGINTWADPFPVKAGNQTFVFFEEKYLNKVKGHICCVEVDSNHDFNFESKRIVLEEPFHLSYPFVFFYKNEYWMMPESAESGAVRLYRAINFPYQWVPEKVILNGVKAYDPTIVEWNGVWYLFCTQKNMHGLSPHAYLYIYYSKDPVSSDWKAHPSNPVSQDVRYSRPAGNFIKIGNRLIRPVQNCAPVYGYSLQFFDVIELTPISYKEQLSECVEPLWDSSLCAVHTYNSIEGLFVMDAQIQVPFYRK